MPLEIVQFIYYSIDDVQWIEEPKVERKKPVSLEDQEIQAKTKQECI